VNKAIADSPVKEPASLLFPPPEELEKRLTRTEPWERHLEFSLLLYSELAGAAEFTIKTLKKARNAADNQFTRSKTVPSDGAQR